MRHEILDGILLIGVVLFHFISGIVGLSCYECDPEKYAHRCLEGTGLSKDCQSKFCMFGNGIWPYPNVTDPIPVMARHCAIEGNSEPDDPQLWALLPTGGQYICKRLTLIEEDVDGRCICNEDNCNSQTWDQAMTNPVMQFQFKTGDKLQMPTLGPKALALLSPTTPKGGRVVTKPSVDHGMTLEARTVITVAQHSGPFVSTSSADAGTASGSTTPPSSKGMGTGTIVGIIAGAALAVTAIFGLYWYFRSKREVDEDDNSDVDEDDLDDDHEDGDLIR